MATRVNMMKLLQEVRGFSELANRRQPARAPGPLLLGASSSNAKARGRRKWILPISIQEPPDIPQPVPIKHLNP